MVSDTGTANGAGRLRPLNQPCSVTVQSDTDGVPHSVDRRAVEAVVEMWCIEDEWWRAHPIKRTYWRLLLEDGRTVDVFRDRICERWYRQAYAG